MLRSTLCLSTVAASAAMPSRRGLPAARPFGGCGGAVVVGCRRPALLGPTRGAMAAAAAGQQVRYMSWNPTTWGRSGGAGRSSNPDVEEELPEIFANQPEEVDDYIRPEKSTFEQMEDFWDWIVSFMQPVEKQVDIMRHLRHDGLAGFDFGGWGHVFFFYGICMRLFTLVFSLYSHRNALRMNAIGTQVSEITQAQNKAKNDRTLSTAEKRVIKDGYNRMKNALYQKHGCAQWKSFFTMLSAPITMSAFISIRRLAMYETDLEMAPFLWVIDLTMPDPTYLLPAICSFMFVVNFEMNQRMQKGGRSATQMYIRWAVRGSAVVGIYFFAFQPSAMFAYWIGLSTAGLVQPILLRYQPFRDFFKFPDPPQVAKAEILSEIKGPSLYERVFASQEEKSRLEAARQEQRDVRAQKRFEKVDDYEVVFEDSPVKDKGKRGGKR